VFAGAERLIEFGPLPALCAESGAAARPITTQTRPTAITPPPTRAGRASLLRPAMNRRSREIGSRSDTHRRAGADQRRNAPPSRSRAADTLGEVSRPAQRCVNDDPASASRRPASRTRGVLVRVVRRRVSEDRACASRRRASRTRGELAGVVRRRVSEDRACASRRRASRTRGVLVRALRRRASEEPVGDCRIRSAAWVMRARAAWARVAWAREDWGWADRGWALRERRRRGRRSDERRRVSTVSLGSGAESALITQGAAGRGRCHRLNGSGARM